LNLRGRISSRTGWACWGSSPGRTEWVMGLTRPRLVADFSPRTFGLVRGLLRGLTGGLAGGLAAQGRGRGGCDLPGRRGRVDWQGRRGWEGIWKGHRWACCGRQGGWPGGEIWPHGEIHVTRVGVRVSSRVLRRRRRSVWTVLHDGPRSFPVSAAAHAAVVGERQAQTPASVENSPRQPVKAQNKTKGRVGKERQVLGRQWYPQTRPAHSSSMPGFGRRRRNPGRSRLMADW
jgi:hypothetical protein